MPENGLDVPIARIIEVLEQDGSIPRGSWWCADDPLTEDIGHQGRLSGPAGHRLGAEARESLARDDRR